MVLIASHPRRRRVPRLDESFGQGVMGRSMRCTIALLWTLQRKRLQYSLVNMPQEQFVVGSRRVVVKT